MPIADIIRLNQTTMTTQQIADLAWYDDRARRAAEKCGQIALARTHDIECSKLCALIKD